MMRSRTDSASSAEKDGNSQSRTTAKAEASDAPDARLKSTVAARPNAQYDDREPGAGGAVALHCCPAHHAEQAGGRVVSHFPPAQSLIWSP